MEKKPTTSLEGIDIDMFFYPQAEPEIAPGKVYMLYAPQDKDKIARIVELLKEVSEADSKPKD
jgi:hypothetical protein